MRELTREEVRIDRCWTDGTTTVIEAAAEMTRYVLVVVEDRKDLHVAIPNFGTSYTLGRDTGPWHWDYLTQKLGKDNARTGMALAILLDMAREASEFVSTHPSYVDQPLAMSADGWTVAW